nr:hypothetical protein [Planctomycetota bacterium]
AEDDIRPGSPQPRQTCIREMFVVGTVYSISVLLAVGPWLVKNAVETRNPVYPLLWSIFDGRDWDAELNVKWKAAHSPPHHEPISFFQEVVTIAVSNDWQSLLVFSLVPLAFVGSHRRSAAAVCAYLAFLYAAWWILTHRIDRFWVPLLPVTCVLAGAGAAWAENLPDRLANPADGAAFRRLWRYGAGGVALLAILFNLGFVTTPLAGNPHYLADLDAVAKTVATPNLAVLNDRLPAGSKVLLVGEAEIFDARFPVVYNTVFDRNIFVAWTAEPQTSQPPENWPLRPTEEIRRTLAEHGITHIFVNWREILRYRTTYGFTAFVTPEKFAALRSAGLLGEPRRIQVAPFLSLDPAQQREAESRFAELIQGRDDDRTYVAGELFPVIGSIER